MSKPPANIKAERAKALIKNGGLFLKRCAECGQDVYLAELDILCDVCEKTLNRTSGKPRSGCS
jgi:Zn finger protein HypA/HybF involved in hydrogenase expression